jgi:hypothetical protein
MARFTTRLKINQTVIVTRDNMVNLGSNLGATHNLELAPVIRPF